MPAQPDFDAVARRYDALRPRDENWWQLFELLVREADLVGRRVLDVGCGTGAFAEALDERGARVWGVDASAEMVDVARSRLPRRVAVRQARAEELPFKDEWFDRAVARLVVHLLDRPRAFGELARVVAPGGRAAVASFDASHVEGYWLNTLFPSLEAIDRARFPSAESLAAELRGGGFREVRIVRLRQEAHVTRETALERVRGRYISTLRLLPEQEYREGLDRAEAELPAEVEYSLEWIVAIAER